MNTIGTAKKPLIPNLILKETVEDLKKGDPGLYLLILGEYELEAFQKQFLAGLYNKIISNE